MGAVTIMGPAALGVADGSAESIRLALMVVVSSHQYGHHKHFPEYHSTITESGHGRKAKHPSTSPFGYRIQAINEIRDDVV